MTVPVLASPLSVVFASSGHDPRSRRRGDAGTPAPPFQPLHIGTEGHAECRQAESDRSRSTRTSGPSSEAVLTVRLPPCGHRAKRSKASARPTGSAVPLHRASHSERRFPESAPCQLLAARIPRTAREPLYSQLVSQTPWSATSQNLWGGGPFLSGEDAKPSI